MVKKEKNIETVEVEYDLLDEDGFHPPSNFYIVNAFGNAVFYLTRTRTKAEVQSRTDYKGKYSLRLFKIK